MDKKEDELFAMEVDEGLYNSKGSSSSSKGRTWLIVGLLFFCFLALITPIFNPGIFIIISLLFLGLFLILEACIDNTRLSASILLIIGIISLIAVIILTKSQYSEIQLTLKYIEIERELASLKGDYFSFLGNSIDKSLLTVVILGYPYSIFYIVIGIASLIKNRK